ncbi:MAG TPA: DUF4010 domain-containing protein [Solimonas sp.]|nr:DUF4010 domain-containing protein [Solimonas sp.]
MDDTSLLRACLASLGIGLLIGVDRERAGSGHAGLRTFALVALAGTATAWLAQKGGLGWLPPAVTLALAALWLGAGMRATEPGQDPGTTTGVALLLCLLLGLMAGYGAIYPAVALAITITLLLHLKTELHGLSRRLSPAELLSFLQFAVLAFVLLPLLPDRGMGPYEALNPYRIGLLVVLISGLSLGGYATLKLMDDHRALPLMGLLGGLVSSTATTLAFARHQRAGSVSATGAALVILLANLTVLLRLALLAAATAPHLLSTLLPVLGGGLLLGVVLPLRTWRDLPRSDESLEFDVKNPAEIGSALGFALLFAVVLVLTAWVNDVAGTAGLYGLALLSGLTDVDAISLSALRLFRDESIAATTACLAIVLAYGANLVFKLGASAVLGGRELARRLAAGFGLVLAGLLAGLWLA